MLDSNAVAWCGLAASSARFRLFSIYGTSGNREMPPRIFGPTANSPKYLLGSMGMAVAVCLGFPCRGNMRALRGVRERCGAQQTNRGARMAPGCIPSVGFRKSTRALLPMRRLRVRRSGGARQQGTRRSRIARAPPHRVRTRCACSTTSDSNNTPHTAPSRSGSPSRRAR